MNHWTRWTRWPRAWRPSLKALSAFSAGLTFFALTGCASSPFAQSDLHVSYSKRTESDKIAVYRNENPKLPFIEIGLVHAACGHYCSSQDGARLLQILRTEASKNGGDALLDIEATRTGLSATVIRYVKPAHQAAR